MPPPTRAKSATADAPVAKPSTMPMFSCMRSKVSTPKTSRISHSDRPSSAKEATHRPMVRPDLKLTFRAAATLVSAA